MQELQIGMADGVTGDGAGGSPQAEAAPARLDLDGVSVGYNGKPVLRDVTVQITHGARVAIVGPNGAGKSTLFKALAGLLPISAGEISIHCQPLGSHQDCIAYVPQREDVDWRFPVTVSDVVMMGRYGRLGWLKRPKHEDVVAVKRGMEQMGIADLAGRRIGELSGGQQQRVFLARALAQEPHILLMDEPFSGIDASTQEATLQLLDRLREQGVTTLVSTHDLTLASTRFDEVMLLNHRLIAYGPVKNVFTPQALSEAFGGQVFFMDGAAVVDQCCQPE
jgi:ABC-type Mn2+/Zn2+ transport system ATPase subunit